MKFVFEVQANVTRTDAVRAPGLGQLLVNVRVNAIDATTISSLHLSLVLVGQAVGRATVKVGDD